jgi:hypothetical protein
MSDAETAAAFVLERVRTARGRLADEGPHPAEGPLPDTPALRVVATRRLRGLSAPARQALLGWGRGERPVDLSRRVPGPDEVLHHQAGGRRFVSLVEDAQALAHGDPRHPDGLSFALHDLCHLEKFAAPEHHRGQVGFFRAMARALADPAMRALEESFDRTWRLDRDYVIADMNGSAVFLFSVLKMRVNMAVRRRLAAARGLPPPTSGALDPDERAALLPALTTLCRALGLPAELEPAALSVNARRDHPADARLLLAYLEALGG